MSQQTDEQLIAQANEIGNESDPGENTAPRIRNMLVNLIDSKKHKTEGDGGVFGGDIAVILGAGEYFGKYKNGDLIPAQGKTPQQVIIDAVTKYIPPAFGSVTIQGQATILEVGSTISGSKTWQWTLTVNSGVVTLVDLVNVSTGTVLLANTPNDGSQAVVVTTVQLNAPGNTQQYRILAHDTGAQPSDIPSMLFTITAWYNRFFGPAVSTPANSATVRALPSNAFQTGPTTFILDTGTIRTKFVVGLPPGHVISSVVDLDALNVNITAQYVLIGTVNVLDAGGTNRAYNIYEMNIGVPYSVSHRHQITTAAA